MDQFQSGVSQPRSIRADVERLLALTFGLTVADVRTDTRDVSTWRGPNDDELLASIQARRKLDTANAVIYVRFLRTALATL